MSGLGELRLGHNYKPYSYYYGATESGKKSTIDLNLLET